MSPNHKSLSIVWRTLKTCSGIYLNINGKMPSNPAVGEEREGIVNDNSRRLI